MGIAALALLPGGCQRRSSPHYACQQLVRAVSEGDAEGVFDSLTQPTQWALYTVQKNHARMWTLVQADYPPKEQSLALSRLYAADAHDGQQQHEPKPAVQRGGKPTASQGFFQHGSIR